MTYKKLVDKIRNDDNFVKEVAKAYLSSEGFSDIEMSLKLPKNSFAKMMLDNPDLRTRISDAISEEFDEEQKIASKRRIKKALDVLCDILDGMEDPQATLKAALGILNFDTKLMRLGKKEEEDEDEIDRLYRELGDELKTEKGFKTRKRNKSKI